ncbi:Superkiller protein 3 [Coemansia sp. RSA 986]|nr:Superkiller protein 3 [Coemansia sp. RSA 986]
MSVIFKTKLKAAKAAVAEKSFDYAYDLCHDLLELDEANYNVHILLGVACQNLGKWDEGERVYKKAAEMPKANMLVWQGLCALYEASKATDKYEKALEDLRDRYLADGMKEKAWEMMFKLVSLAEESNDARKLINMLRQLTDEGPLHCLIDPSMETDPAPPSLQALLERLYNTENELDNNTIEKEINKRRTRIDAGPIATVRKTVKEEVWCRSGVLDTLKQLISLNSEQEEVLDQKLHFEELYFYALLERIPILDDIQAKSAMVDEMRAVSWDLVSQGKCAGAFEHLIEAADCDDSENTLSQLAESYMRSFPEARLVPFVQTWMAVNQGTCATDTLDLARDNAKLHLESVFACVQLVQAASFCKEYQLVIDTGIASRTTAKIYYETFGQNLWRSQHIIDMEVADAYMAIGSAYAGDAEYLYRKCLETEPGDIRTILGLGLSLCALNSYGESHQLLEKALEADPQSHLALGGLGYVATKEGHLQDAVGYLQRAIDINPDYAAHHASLGNAYWQMGDRWQQDKQFAYTSWIKAARIDPKISDVFSGLGKWYQQFGSDDERAQKCFRKALDLDITNSDAGKILAEMYLREGMDDMCEELLDQVTEARQNQKWAWQFLGFLRLRQENFEEAIIAFRSALGLDREDCLCWEGLCEAYMGIGRLNTAIRVSQKIVELDPSRVSGHWLYARACLMTGDLKLSLSHLEQAAECVEKCDRKDSSGVQVCSIWDQPLTIAKAECLLAFAEKWSMEGLSARMAEASGQALHTMQQYLSQQVDKKYPVYLTWNLVYAACAWGIKSRCILDSHPELVSVEDIRTLIKTGNELAEGLELPGFLAETLETGTRGWAQAKCVENNYEYDALLFELTVKAAQLRIQSATSAALASMAWVDLGKLYFERQAEMSVVPLQPSNSDADDDTEAQLIDESLLEAAARCALAGIQLDPDCVSAYNLQGVVASFSRGGDRHQQAALAQHAFIMASRRSPGSPVPWANLGYLYMHHGDIELANKAFYKAQTVDPEFTPGWIGQAIIAETLGSAECVELFETCLLSSAVPKAAAYYGYARQVWKHAIENNQATSGHSSSRSEMSAKQQNRLVFAIYAAHRYVERTGDSSGAPGSHLLGLLLEQNQEYENAVAAYEAAYKRVISSGMHDKARIWIALTHLGRAQCSAERYSDAVETYEQADALLSGEDTGDMQSSLGPEVKKQVFYFTLGYSLSLFFADRLEESLDRFEQALVQSESIPSVRPPVAVMLAQVLWALGTDEHRAIGRQHLLEVIGEHTDYLPGLSSLFAMGVLQGDDELVGAAYAELKMVRNGSDGNITVAKLESYLAAARGDALGGRRALAKAVHRSPDDGSLWLLLAEFEALCGRQDAAIRGSRAALELFRLAMRGHFSWNRKPSRGQANSASLDMARSALVVESQALMTSQGQSDGQKTMGLARSAAKRAVMYQPWSQDARKCLLETTF